METAKSFADAGHSPGHMVRARWFLGTAEPCLRAVKGRQEVFALCLHFCKCVTSGHVFLLHLQTQ